MLVTKKLYIILSLFFCSGDGGEDGDSNAGDQEAPEPSELIEALQELENSASSDAVVRYGIFKMK